MDKKIIIFLIVSFLGGIVLFAMHHDWIIINIPYHMATHNDQLISKKQIMVYWWQHDQWNQESHNVIWSKSQARNSEICVTHLLDSLHDNQELRKKIYVQAAALMPSGHDLIVSFDALPFTPDDPMIKKWMIIESILKTIRSNTIALTSVHFLVNHQPMIDRHLDFSLPWPIQGFM